MSRYSKLQFRTNKKNDDSGRLKKIFKSYKTPYYSRVPFSPNDMYFITQEGDRLDKLAMQFYGDPHHWWYIAKINNLKTMNVEAGVKIRIPVDKNGSYIL